MPAPLTRTRLSQTSLKELLNYDRHTGIFTWKVDRTYLARAGDEAGTLRKTDGNVIITVKGKVWMANRLAWLYIQGELPPGRLIAVNGKRDDLRWSNIALERDYLSTHPVAVYERRRRRKAQLMREGRILLGDDLKELYYDPRDPNDPRNVQLYVSRPPRAPRVLPRDENGRIIAKPKT